ncbi:MAG: hypothetical protein L0338_29905, partial [Acidobacteria bacterium]|nr:hypothetical protein [Acidobacteriota bacterium]
AMGTVFGVPAGTAGGSFVFGGFAGGGSGGSGGGASGVTTGIGAVFGVTVSGGRRSSSESGATSSLVLFLSSRARFHLRVPRAN